jgi:methylated-DNA-[protein]-cysteine S-methyltransferase
MIDAVVYLSTPTAWGELFLATSGQGLCRSAWYISEISFSAEIADERRCPVRRVEHGESELLDESCRQLSEYVAGRRTQFDLPIDLGNRGPFQRAVYDALLKVPYGEVVSYGELAALAGYSGAARAVGSAMRDNPLAIVIPCHRVILGSGALGGFGGRPDLKRQLLAIEGWGKL